MLAPPFTATHFTTAMQALLPRGPVWPRSDDAELTDVIKGLAPVYAQNTVRANNLLVDAFPSTTTELLTDWEKTLGLPGRFGYTGTDVPTRRAQVVAALTDSGGQSLAFFIGKALQMGFTITINQFTFSHVGSPVDAPLYGVPWAYAMQINVATGTDVTTLTAMLDAYCPAHCTYFFHFF